MIRNIFFRTVLNMVLISFIVLSVPQFVSAHGDHFGKTRTLPPVTKDLKKELSNTLLKGVKVESLDDLLKNKKIILKNFRTILENNGSVSKGDIDQIISELNSIDAVKQIPPRPKMSGIKLSNIDLFKTTDQEIQDGNALFQDVYEGIFNNLVENYQRYETNQKGEEVLDWEIDSMADSTAFAPEYFFTLSEDLAKDPNADPALVTYYWDLAEKTVKWEEKVLVDLLTGRVNLTDPKDPHYDDSDYFYSLLASPAIPSAAKHLKEPKYFFTSSLILSFTSLLLRNKESSEDFIKILEENGLYLDFFGEYEFLVGLIAALDMEYYFITGKKTFANLSISLIDQLWEEIADPETGLIEEKFISTLENAEDIYSASSILTALAKQYQYTKYPKYLERAQEVTNALDEWLWRTDYRTYHLDLSANVAFIQALVNLYQVTGDLKFVTKAIRTTQYMEDRLYYEGADYNGQQSGPMFWHHIEEDGALANWFCTGDNFLFLYNTYLMKKSIQEKGDIVPLVSTINKVTSLNFTDQIAGLELQLKNYSDFNLNDIAIAFSNSGNTVFEFGSLVSDEIKIFSSDQNGLPLMAQLTSDQWMGLGNIILEQDIILNHGLPNESSFSDQSIIETLQTIDTDQDGLSDIQEVELGTNPSKMDSDDDGIPDKWEIDHSLNPLDSSDANLDSDGNGLTTYEEYSFSKDHHFDYVTDKSVFQVNSEGVDRSGLDANSLRIGWSSLAGIVIYDFNEKGFIEGQGNDVALSAIKAAWEDWLINEEDQVYYKIFVYDFQTKETKEVMPFVGESSEVNYVKISNDYLAFIGEENDAQGGYYLYLYDLNNLETGAWEKISTDGGYVTPYLELEMNDHYLVWRELTSPTQLILYDLTTHAKQIIPVPFSQSAQKIVGDQLLLLDTTYKDGFMFYDIPSGQTSSKYNLDMKIKNYLDSDGRYVTFVEDSGNQDVYVYDLQAPAGQNIKRITNYPSEKGYPSVLDNMIFWVDDAGEVNNLDLYMWFLDK